MNTMRLDIDGDGVATLTMDAPDSPVNVFSREFADDLEVAVGKLESSNARCMILASAKSGNFHAGADLKGFSGKLPSRDEATEMIRGAQKLIDRIRYLKIPVVAAIHGTALGGGCELALACHARVCTKDRSTKIGLPEVQLGLLPAAGGCTFLPRLIGLADALDIILAGKQVVPRKAKKLGLVDEVVPKAVLLQAARELALSMADQPSADEGALARFGSTVKQMFRGGELQDLLLEDNPLGRKVLFDQARKRLLKKTRGNYPAPERALEAIQIATNEGIEAGLDAEARFFGELVTGPVAQELVRIFHVTTAMKKETGVDDPNVVPRPVDKVAVLGAGLMGAGIAYVTTARAKTPVRIKDRDAESVGRGLGAVRKIHDERVKRKRATARDRDEQMAMVSPTTDYSGFESAQVVIEAVFEDVDLKHSILREVEEVCGPETIFASNTSTIPITRIAEASAHPETVIGMHYFSPVEKMPLLEIIITEKTAPWVTATCVDLGKRQGKTVIVVRDGVGFYTSRILGPYMNEAFRILAEGVAIEKIDNALLDFGFPVGPVKLLDEVGIDVAHKASKVVRETHGDDGMPSGLDTLIEDGRYGRKSKKGFYLYGGKKKGVDESVYHLLGIHPTVDMPAEKIAERCVLQMVNEAYKCKNEGILLSDRDGDIGAIFGLGFPPFRGGPFRYTETVGVDAIRETMKKLAAQHGSRFDPAM